MKWRVAFILSSRIVVSVGVDDAPTADAAIIRAVEHLEKVRPELGDDANCAILAGERVQVIGHTGLRA